MCYLYFVICFVSRHFPVSYLSLTFWDDNLHQCADMTFQRFTAPDLQTCLLKFDRFIKIAWDNMFHCSIQSYESGLDLNLRNSD